MLHRNMTKEIVIERGSVLMDLAALYGLERAEPDYFVLATADASIAGIDEPQTAQTYFRMSPASSDSSESVKLC